MSKKHPKIGIMSGRLSKQIGSKIQSFPAQSWKNEFKKASMCGFEVLEWIFDLYEKNPILDNTGIKEIRSLSEKYNVKINSICADYFMERMLFNVTHFELEKNLVVLNKLIKRCHDLEIKILEIPFVDSSSIKNLHDVNQLLVNLQKVLPEAENNDVKITLETDLPPRTFKDLLLKFNNPNIKANYDTGNSTSLGYNMQEELKTLGKWIVNIHIKDRKYNGGTVQLGTGDTDFDLFFSTLRKINYKGDLIIQGAREINSTIKPEITCKKYLTFVKQYVHKYL